MIKLRIYEEDDSWGYRYQLGERHGFAGGWQTALEARQDGMESLWWTWQDQDYDRQSASLAEGEVRCQAWIAGESTDGPLVEVVYD